MGTSAGIVIIAYLVMYFIFSAIIDRKRSKISDYTKSEIDKFYFELYSLKKDYITFGQRDKLKQKYEGFFNNQQVRMHISNPLVKDFIEKYKSIDELVIKWNNEMLEKEHLDTFLGEIDKFNIEIDILRKDYITYLQRNMMKEKFDNLSTIEFVRVSKNNSLVKEFIEKYDSLDKLVVKWNEEFVEKELRINKEMLDDIDGKSLDLQQREAVVTDEINSLVLAGAGSGKTLTITAKVKYLVDRKGINPDEILLISYTRKSAEEMTNRVKEKLGINIEAMTFHKIGLDIITKNGDQRPNIAKENSISDFMYQYLKTNGISNRKEISQLLNFLGYYIYIPEDPSNYSNFGERIDNFRRMDFETLKHKVNIDENNSRDSKANKREFVKNELKIKKNTKETIQGEVVKSLEELIIANYLFLNGIEYIYEYEYPYDQEDKHRKKYEPDFYLPEYGIYLEHFGITENYRVPWLSKIEEKKYLEGIKYKRLLHKKNGTKLLETYSYYNRNGLLLLKLEQILRDKGVEFREVDINAIYKQMLSNRKKSNFRDSIKIFGTFIQLFKSNGYSVDKFRQFRDEVDKYENIFIKERAILFLDIVQPIYIEYEKYLKENSLIDFNDMINIAADIVDKNNLNLKHKYIIIDEYQDISVSRFKLIKHIRERSESKIICVGDDWQSIYRFAGSDINLFTNFEDYFGQYKLLKIENTYRNSQELVNVAGKFVMENKQQMVKNLVSKKKHNNPLRVLTYGDRPSTAVKKAVEEIVNSCGNESKITILGRNNFDIERIEKDVKYHDREFSIQKKSEGISVKLKKYPDVEIEFMSIHRSKGLEADNIILINLENDTYGFPNMVSDDPILSLVLTRIEDFDYAEERRLFYVAITRTKNSTYLVAPEKNKSIFCEELIGKFNIKCENADHKDSIINNPKCPSCQKGYLVIRQIGDQEFLGCTNYPYCDFTSNHTEIIDNQIECGNCGGYMVKRNGPRNEFYGCTNYPYCKNVMEIEEAALDNSSSTTDYNDPATGIWDSPVDRLIDKEIKKDFLEENTKVDVLAENAKVDHKRFGEGIVIWNDGKLIKIEFKKLGVVHFDAEACKKENLLVKIKE